MKENAGANEPEQSLKGLLWCFLFYGGDHLLLAQFLIPLDPRTKKNGHRISGCGPRCPVCGKFQRQFIRNNTTTTDFAFRAAQYIHPRPEKPLEGPVHLVYRIYTQTRRRVDDLNLYEALDDILVNERILSDDNRNVIRCRDGSRVLYDKENPRAEIYIYDYQEEGNNGSTKRHQDIHSG